MSKELSFLFKSLSMLVVLLCVGVLFFIYQNYKSNRGIKNSTIIVSGEGKVEARPDKANINLTIREEGKTNEEAQQKVNIKAKKFLNEISSLVSEDDIKTNNFNSYPKYNWTQNGGQIKIGEEVTQSIYIKIKEKDNVAKVLSLLAGNSINEYNGPNFDINDSDMSKYKEEARSVAIKDSKDKAKKLADQLGVSIVKISSFNEDNNNYQPMYVMKSAAADMQSRESVAPTINPGTNTVTSNVSITFEIE